MTDEKTYREHIVPLERDISRLRAYVQELLEANNRDLELRREAERKLVAAQEAIEQMTSARAVKIVDLEHALAECQAANGRLLGLLKKSATC